MTARSYLYVPGHRSEMLSKAAGRGADALILDLEDAVPPDAKDAARRAVAEWLREHASGALQVWVRINAGDRMEADARAVAAAGAAGISLPKVSSRADVERLEGVLGDAGLPISALIETAAGVLDARAIASHPRVTRLAIGEADLGAELGLRPGPGEEEWAPIRAQIVLASAAAGIEPPVGPISTDFGDLEGLRRSTDALRRMGFGARAAIHPAQVAVINEAFTPSAEEIEAARRLLGRFEAAGGAATTDDDGRMIDEAVVRAARRTIALTGEA